LLKKQEFTVLQCRVIFLREKLLCATPLPNKEAQASAEVVEGRVRTKENIGQSHTPPAQNGHGVSQGLAGVRHASI
jgi:hypothetical protein